MRIYVGHGDPLCKDDAVMPCEHCGTLVDYEPWDFRFCPDCHGLLTSDELEMAVARDESQSEEVAEPTRNSEPRRKAYEDAEPGWLLALIGERLVSTLPGNERR